MPHYEGESEASLATRLGLPRVVVLDETGSTLDVAHELADRGAPAGTLVVADAQRAGRGRQGRTWASSPGHGVWCTMVARIADAKALDVLSIRVGLLAAEALDDVAGERVRVKWPNDLLLSRGKLAGILCETRWSGQAPAWVAIGIGVNVIAPEGVAGAAGMPPGTARLDLLARIARGTRSAAASAGWLSKGELERYAARDALAGVRIASPAAGIAVGIDDAGALLVKTSRGTEAHRTGTVVLEG